MNDQMTLVVRALPRRELEDLAIRAMREIRLSRFEAAPNIYFNAVLTGFLVGVVVAVCGFLAGAAVR